MIPIKILIGNIVTVDKNSEFVIVGSKNKQAIKKTILLNN